jgi:hypothetical protein
MKASLDLIKKLRAQLPPEAAEQLDALEGLAGADDDSVGAQDLPADGAEGEDELMLDAPEGDGASGMDALRDTLGEGEGAPEDEALDEEASDEPVPVNASASKKKAKKPSFWS